MASDNQEMLDLLALVADLQDRCNWFEDAIDVLREEAGLSEAELEARMGADDDTGEDDDRPATGLRLLTQKP